MPVRQCSQKTRSQEGRPGFHLHADDSGTGSGNAGLCPHRSYPFHCLRRIFTYSTGGYRIVDSTCTLVVTADGSYRGSKPVALKTNVDEAIVLAQKEGVTVKSCIVAKRVGDKIETSMTVRSRHLVGR